MLKYHRCPDGNFKVWRLDWAQDQFEVLSQREFTALVHAVEVGPLRPFVQLVEHFDEED